MPLQTTYNESPAIAFPGQLLVGHDSKESVFQADVVSIPFGMPVAYKPSAATTDFDVTIPANSTDKLRGMFFRSDGFSRAWTDENGTRGDLDGTGLRPGRFFDIARWGEIWVLCQTGCVPGDRLFVSYSAGSTYTAAGQLGNAAEASHTIDATAKGEWKTTATAGQFARLEFDFRNK